MQVLKVKEMSTTNKMVSKVFVMVFPWYFHVFQYSSSRIPSRMDECQTAFLLGAAPCAELNSSFGIHPGVQQGSICLKSSPFVQDFSNCLRMLRFRICWCLPENFSSRFCFIVHLIFFPRKKSGAMAPPQQSQRILQLCSSSFAAASLSATRRAARLLGALRLQYLALCGWCPCFDFV